MELNDDTAMVALSDQPKRLPTDPLSAQEAIFVANYSGPGTGTSAYKAAFPNASPTACRSGAVRMLNLANVRAHVSVKIERQLWGAEISAARIMREEAAIAFSSAADLMDHLGVIPPDQLPEKVARAVKSFKYKRKQYYDKEGNLYEVEDRWEYQFWDKGAALRRLEEMIQMVRNPGDGIRDGLESLAVALDRALNHKYRAEIDNG